MIVSPCRLFAVRAVELAATSAPQRAAVGRSQYGELDCQLEEGEA